MLDKFFRKNHSKPLSKRAQMLFFVLGLCFVSMGLIQIFYERSKIPICSREILEESSQDHLFFGNHLSAAVDGAVVKPGIYELPVGSRVSELLDAAEGLAALVDREYLAKNFNLAEKLTDSQKIYIPFKGEFGKASEVESKESAITNSTQGNAEGY